MSAMTGCTAALESHGEGRLRAGSDLKHGFFVDAHCVC
jgi:hypothetical protein